MVRVTKYRARMRAHEVSPAQLEAFFKAESWELNSRGHYGSLWVLEKAGARYAIVVQTESHPGKYGWIAEALWVLCRLGGQTLDTLVARVTKNQNP